MDPSLSSADPGNLPPSPDLDLTALVAALQAALAALEPITRSATPVHGICNVTPERRAACHARSAAAARGFHDAADPRPVYAPASGLPAGPVYGLVSGPSAGPIHGPARGFAPGTERGPVSGLVPGSSAGNTAPTTAPTPGVMAGAMTAAITAATADADAPSGLTSGKAAGNAEAPCIRCYKISPAALADEREYLNYHRTSSSLDLMTKTLDRLNTTITLIEQIDMTQDLPGEFMWGLGQLLRDPLDTLNRILDVVREMEEVGIPERA